MRKVRSGKFEVRSIGAIAVLALLLATALSWAGDWSNPDPRAGSDTAGQLLLKHESNMTDLYSKLSSLKKNFGAASSPASQSTGQAWYDTTNKYFQVYDATWGGGGFYSSGTSSFFNVYSGGTITAVKFVGPLTGNVSGNVTGNVTGSSGSCTGNSATATNATQLNSQAASYYTSGTNIVSWIGSNAVTNATNAAAATTATNASGTGTAVYSPTAGIQIIRGTLNTNGTPLYGGDYSSGRESGAPTGDYRIYFNFSAPPTCTVSAHGTTSATATEYVIDYNTMRVQVFDGGGLADRLLSFICVGPK